MSRPRSSSFNAAQKTFQPPSRMDWNDERLAALDPAQLKSLLDNLAVQRAAGRVTEDTAADLTRRITARLPARALTVRRSRPRSLIQLDARVAEGLGGLATELGQRYDLSDDTARRKSADIVGFRPETATDKHGLAKAGIAMKKGSMAIDRSVGYRVRDSMASLAFLLLPDQPQETGRYVILATDDLLESGVPIAEVLPASRDHGWSRKSRERMRAQPVENFAQAQALYEGLIARVAAKRDEKG
jgi:hypothetical protein